MNLAELQRKTNNVIAVTNSLLRNFGDLVDTKNSKDITINLLDENGNTVETTMQNLGKIKANFDSWRNGLILSSIKNDFAISKTFDFNDGEWVEMLKAENEIPYGEYLFVIYFSTTGKGGSIYSARATGIITFGSDSNNDGSIAPIPFSLGYHAINGRTIELALIHRGNNENKLHNRLAMKINGESPTDVTVNMLFKKIF